MGHIHWALQRPYARILGIGLSVFLKYSVFQAFPWHLLDIQSEFAYIRGHSGHTEKLSSPESFEKFFFLFFFFLIKPFLRHFLIFIYLFIFAVLGLRFCGRAFSSCGKRGPLFIAVRGPLTITASLRSTGSRRAGSVIVAHGPSCSVACGIFPDQGSNPCPLHWQADSQPLRHQGSPL